MIPHGTPTQAMNAITAKNHITTHNVAVGKLDIYSVGELLHAVDSASSFYEGFVG